MLLILTALSLSMDAFSLAIIYGTKKVSKIQKIVLSILVGINHFILPIIGQKIGYQLFNNKIFDLDIITMIVFTIIGIEMLISKEKGEVTKLTTLEMLIFAFSVSIDSFIIGITYLERNIILSSTVFLIFSSFLTFAGLQLGHIISVEIGSVAKKVGGISLILIGLYTLLV